MQIINAENDEAQRDRNLQLSTSTGGADLYESLEQIDKTLTEAQRAIGVFVANENDPGLLAEVQGVLQGDYDRKGLVDALLHTFKKYQLAQAV